MAFTQTPQQSTYNTKRFSFIGSPLQRSGVSLKDQRFVNVYPEVVKTEQLSYTQNKKYFLRKRPGMVAFSTPGTSGEGRASYYFNNHLYTAVGTKFYKDNVVMAGITFNGATGQVGIAQGDSSSAGYKYIFVCDGISAWVVKADDTVTAITDVNFPNPHIPTPIFIDGYIAIPKANSADIYNSTLDDPTLWDASFFITAEMYPDNIVALVKNNNYFFGLGTNTIEYFFDGANAVGSPFAVNPSGTQQLGCVSSTTVAQADKKTVFLGSTAIGGRSVWSVEGFKSEEIAVEPIKMILDAEGSSLTNAHMFVVRISGHEFLVINLTSRTIVYDFNEKFWCEWSYNGGVLPFNYMADNPSGSPYLINSTTGYVVTLSDTSYQDIGAAGAAVPMECISVTNKIDFESNNRKTAHRYSLIGDVPNDAADTVVYISYSDDDYKTYSTEIQLLFNNNMACITQLGQFRRRAFKLRYLANYPLRLEGYEVDVNIGIS